MKQLPLYQEIALLALDNQKGTANPQTGYAIAGAILAELSLRQAIDVDSKSKVVSFRGSVKLNNPILSEVATQIRDSKSPKKIDAWVAAVAATGKLQQRVAVELCELGILTHQQTKWLGLFPFETYPTIRPKVENRIKSRMAKLMFGQTIRHDSRTTVLVSIAKHTGLLNPNFDKDRLRRNKDRIEKVANGSLLVARAPRDMAVSAQTALMFATLIPGLQG